MNRTASSCPLFLAVVGLAAITLPAAATEMKSPETRRNFRHALLLGLRGMKEFLAESPLVDLEKGHYGVKLSSEDFHRITLWLDSSSMFYGVYEKEGGEGQLRGEIARLTLQ